MENWNPFMAQEQRKLNTVDDIAEFEGAITDWFSRKEKPTLQIKLKDVAQYATASTSSFGAEEVKEDICRALNAGLLDAPDSIVEKIMDENDDQTISSVFVVVKLLLSGYLPPPRLSSSILCIFLTKDGNDLTNHLLEFQTTTGDRFRENLGKLVDKAEHDQSLA